MEAKIVSLRNEKVGVFACFLRKSKSKSEAKHVIHRNHCFLFSYEGISTKQDLINSRNAEKLREHLKNRNSSHTAGTPKKEWTLIKVGTPGTEGMSTRAGPQHQQNATLQHEC
jgi:hypothetical protein